MRNTVALIYQKALSGCPATDLSTLSKKYFDFVVDEFS